MQKIKNEKELLKKLYSDVNDCGKDKIVLLAGHFPLIYKKEEEKAVEEFKLWGVFSIYSLELACKVADYAKKKKKKVQFVFFVDDHMYEDITNITANSRSKRRNRLYLERSGKNAKLSEIYRKIMKKYDFSEKNVLRHNHKKKGREDCLYFSEKVLRASKRKIDNLCAKEYTEFIEDKTYFSKEKSYMVAFIPQRCKENICSVALDIEIKDLNSTHIFMDTMTKLATRKKLYSVPKGVTYRKD